MRWPNQPVESVHPSRFLPPWCPHRDCRDHQSRQAGFQRWGCYRNKDSAIKIPRFKCNACKKTCSRQTFSTTYYLKRPELLVAVAADLVAGAAHRQIGRTHHAAKTSVTRMAERLGRHAILFHAHCLDQLAGISEPIVHDHFETFIRRQDHALGVGTAVGANSWFLYDVDPAPHKGSGRRPDRKTKVAVDVQGAYVKSIRRTFSRLLAKIPATDSLRCITDARRDYETALKSVPLRRVELTQYANPERRPKGSTRSAEAIARDDAMFPVDSLHQLLRHTCADHKRETLSFGRRLESILGRAHLVAVWRNFVKRRSERRPDPTTPAMWLGLADTRWRWERVLCRRLFPTRIQPSESALTLYWKRWTPNLPALKRVHAK